MRKIKIGISLLLLFVISFPLYGCSLKEPFPWVIGNGSPEDTVTHLFTMKFAEEVERLSNGEIQIQVYGNSTLGGDSELLENCATGEVEFLVQNTAPQTSYIKETAVFDLPCVFDNIEQVRETVDNPEFLDTLNQAYENKNFRLLALADQGFRIMTCNKEIKTIDGFKGIKIRTMENPNHILFWKDLNANPTPMAFNEVYIGLQQGVLDAQENPYEVIVSGRFYEQQTYCVETNHLPHLLTLVTNNEFYNSLPEEQKKIIDEAAFIAKEYARTQSDERIASRKETILADQTTDIVELSDELKQAIREQVSDIEPFIRKQAGDKLVDLFLQKTK